MTDTIKRTSAQMKRERKRRSVGRGPPSMLDAPPAPDGLSIVDFARNGGLMIRKTSAQKCEGWE